MQLKKRITNVIILIFMVSVMGIAENMLCNITVMAASQDRNLKLPRMDENQVVSWDCIYFGNYWQNDTNRDGNIDEKDGKQPIKWRVLSIEGNEAFLLADRCLATRPNMTDDTSEGSWEKSEVRKWLNDDFLKDAFSAGEQRAIQLKTYDNTETGRWLVSGNDTQDKIALMSKTEVDNPDYGLREGRYSRWASDGKLWELRTVTEGSFGKMFTRVPHTIEAEGFGSRVTMNIRPILYLDLSSAEWENAEAVLSVPYEIKENTQELPVKQEPEEVPVTFDKEKIVHQGVDGDISWSIDANGCLYLEGDGDWEGLGNSFVIVGDESFKYPKWLDYYNDIITAKVKITGITNCKRMFYGLWKLRAIDFSGSDTSNVTNMQDMFRTCTSLTTLHISDLDTSNVQDMENMFARCSELRKLDLSSFDTSNVTDMFGMFQACENLQTVNLSSFDTSKVKTMIYMFERCDKLRKLDLSNFDLSGLLIDKNTEDRVFNIDGLYLDELKTPRNLSGTLFENERDSSNSKALPVWSRATTPWKDAAGEIYTELPVDTSRSITLTRQVKEDLLFSGVSGKLKWDVDLQGKLTISGKGEWKEEGGYADYPQWHEARDYITSCEVDVTGITNASYMFGDLPFLREIQFNNFDTSQVTDMSYMFYNDNSLISIDVTGFDTSQVTDMTGMFCDCHSLTHIDVFSFNTEKVSDFGLLFARCRELEKLDLRNMDTSQSSDFNDMFYGCFKLKQLQMQNVEPGSLQCIFECCHSLTNLDISSWNLKDVPEREIYNTETDSMEPDAWTSFLGGAVSLSQIRTPINLKVEVALPEGNWTDETGKQYTTLPMNQKKGILLKNSEKPQYEWGSVKPLPTLRPTPTPTITPTPTPTITPTITITPTPTVSPAASPNPQGTSTSAPTPSTNSVKEKRTVAVPARVKISGAKNKKGKKAVIRWKKIKGAAGYQVAYATNKKFKKKKSKLATKTTVTLKKLKKKKTYYIKVRAYTMSNGKKVYGKWSKVKKVKIRK